MINREDFRSIIDCMGNPVFIKDQQYRYVLVNTAACRLYSIPHDAYSGKSDYDLFAKEEADVFREHDTSVLETGKVQFSEDRIVDRQGDIRVIATKRAICTTQAGKKYIVGTARDLTESKQTENTLREAERYLRTLIDNIPNGIARFNADYRHLFVNPAVAKTVGIPAEDFVGKTQREIATAKDDVQYHLFDEKLKEVFDKGTINKIELEWKTPDGYVCIDSLQVPERDENGNVTSVLAIGHDVTERRHAEKALHRLNRELRAISNCNQTLLRAVDEQTLLNDVCRIVCDEAGYRMAWVGYAEDDIARNVRPVAWAGVEDGYLAKANITWFDTQRGRGPTGEAIRSGKTAYVHDIATDPRMDPWRENAIQRGYRSTIALPLKDNNGKTFGALHIYSTELNPFIRDEIRLLEELSGNLAFGIMVQRERIEHRRSQEELRQKTALLEAQLDVSLDGIIVTEKSRKVLQNQQFVNLFKIPTHIAADDDNEIQLEWAKGLSKNSEEFDKMVAYMATHPDEVRRDEFALKDGTVLERYSSPVVGKDGSRYGRIETFRDITERKRSEEVLQAGKFRLSEAMDLAKIVYWEYDPVADVYIYDDVFYTFYGTDVEREGGYRMTSDEYAKRFIHPYDHALFRQSIRAADLRDCSEPIPDVEHRIIRRNGEMRHILVRTRIIPDDSGNPIKVYGTNQDITERKKMIETIRESERLFRMMFEESPTGMVMVGSDFRYMKANAAFCAMLGYTEQELTSLSVRDISHPDHAEDDIQSFHNLISGKISIHHTEKRYIKKDKDILWGSTTVNVMHGTDSRFLYLLGTIEDITQRKESEEENKRLESQLFQAQKMEAVGTLAGGIAHDFNNILTVLAGYAVLLQMKIKDESLRTYADHILSASRKATDLIQGLLTFSRQQPARLKPVSIHSIIEDAEKLLKRLVTEDITFRTVLDTRNITIMADATQIDQILFNLVTNSRDAMPQGGTFTMQTKLVKLDDEFRRYHGYGQPGTYLLLSVTDTGTGMDATTQKRIFDPFFTTKEVGKGTGLGLSTVYGIIKQHNGYIAVYSEPNMGTTFHIYLPAVPETSRATIPPSSSMTGGNEIILVVEDNDDVRDLVVSILQEHGYETIYAKDGVDAIEQVAANNRIDLIVLDSVMPRMNGREAYREIIQIRPDMKVVFTSGHTRDVFLDKGIEDEKLNFLQKPILPDVLLKKVREILDGGQEKHSSKA